ncbi:hypothetical protein [Rhizobium rhizogenes]|uniref:hypothetical protein n=1 Tax=Rhizobium rhizogenes TaxID=359 RepID=UPI00226EE627|nr:hypothetical protein [Rhizobium rhizogenes]
MSVTPHPLVAAALAMPNTHEVVTLFADGTSRSFKTRNRASAENYAVGERRKIGKDLINRDTGATVHVVDVYVAAL